MIVGITISDARVVFHFGPQLSEEAQDSLVIQAAYIIQGYMRAAWPDTQYLEECLRVADRRKLCTHDGAR